MTTPQQFLESFLKEKVGVYAQANARLLPVYTKYFGEPIAKDVRDFLLLDRVDAFFEEIKQSPGSAVVITRQEFRSGSIRTRYHLAAVDDSWKIVRIDRECFLCRGSGRLEGMICRKCTGEGWCDPRQNGA